MKLQIQRLINEGPGLSHLVSDFCSVRLGSYSWFLSADL